MQQHARKNHAKHGRVFETSMLLFDIKHCDCCGITVPFHDDPQMQKLASSRDHTFRRSHLVMCFYEAWFCDCEEMCHGGQYFALRKSKEIAWFANKHGFNPEDGLCDDAKKLICESCYKDPNGDSMYCCDL
jgi:hypothetical protein